MSLLSNLASAIDEDFKAVLPLISSVAIDMTQNYSAWQSNPIVKSTEAVAVLTVPVVAVDAQAVLGAVSLVQALWKVFGETPPPPVVKTAPTPEPTTSVDTTTHEVLQIATPAAAGNFSPDIHSTPSQSEPVSTVSGTSQDQSHM